MPLTNQPEENLAQDNSNCGVIAKAAQHSSHQMMEQARIDARRVDSRGGSTPDIDGKVTGDGAGASFSIPHRLLQKDRNLSSVLEGKQAGQYGVGHFYFSQDRDARTREMDVIESIFKSLGLKLTGARQTPIEKSVLSSYAAHSMPHMEQWIVEPQDPRELQPDARPSFEEKLRLASLIIEAQAQDIPGSSLHVASLSSDTISYKSLTLMREFFDLFPDLTNEDFETLSYVLHVRFSTNSMPQWGNCHPFHNLAHNGEINSSSSNQAHGKSFEAQYLIGRIAKRFNIDPNVVKRFHEKGGSDSKELARQVTMVSLAWGVPVDVALFMLMPPIIKHSPDYSPEQKAFVSYLHGVFSPACGPANIIVNADGKLGAMTESGGYRPSVVCTYQDQILGPMVAFGSELATEGSNVTRMQTPAGGISFVDLKSQHLQVNQDNSVLFEEACQAMGFPSLTDFYTQYQAARSTKTPDVSSEPKTPTDGIAAYQAHVTRAIRAGLNVKAKDFIETLAATGKPQTIAMGDDAAAAVFMRTPRFDKYFKHKFVMVTAPNTDPEREFDGTSLEVFLGANPYLAADKIGVGLSCDSPILDQTMYEVISRSELTSPIPMVIHRRESWASAITRICQEVKAQVMAGKSIIRFVHPEHMKGYLPDILLVSAVDEYLKQENIRQNVSLVVDTMTSTDPHQVCCLLAMGASAVYPRMAYEHMEILGQLTPSKYNVGQAHQNIKKGLELGLKLNMAKVGFSTAKAYIGAKGAVLESFGLRTQSQTPREESDPSQSLAAYFGHGVGETFGVLGMAELEGLWKAEQEALASFLTTEEGKMPNLPDPDKHFPKGFSDRWTRYFRAMVDSNNAQKVEDAIRSKSQIQSQRQQLAKLVEVKRRIASTGYEQYQASLIDYLGAMDLATKSQEAFERAEQYSMHLPEGAIGQLTQAERRLYHALDMKGDEARFSCAVFAKQAWDEWQHDILRLSGDEKVKAECRYDELLAALGEHEEYKKWFDHNLWQNESADPSQGINPLHDIQFSHSPARAIFKRFLAKKLAGSLPRYSYGINNAEGIPEIKVDGRYSKKMKDTYQTSKGFEVYNEQMEREQAVRPSIFHNFLAVQSGLEPISVQGVVPVSELLRYIISGAMSNGSLKGLVHGDIAEAHNAIGSMGSNNGEGGLPSQLYGTRRAGRNQQWASGHFGANYELVCQALDNGSIQVKIAQGAKPGVGGELPGDKVNEEIAEARHCLPRVPLISPPPHHDIYSVEDFKSLVIALRASGARVSVKLAATKGVGTVAVGVAKCGVNNITIACGTGGTGAAKHYDQTDSGLSGFLGLVEVHQALVQNGLRDDVTLTATGSFKSVKDFLMHAMYADIFESGTIQLAGGGCVAIDKCFAAAKMDPNGVLSGGCSVGVTNTMFNYKGTPEQIERMNLDFVAEMRRELAAMGFTSIEDMKKANLVRIRNKLAAEDNTILQSLLKEANTTVGDFQQFFLQHEAIIKRAIGENRYAQLMSASSVDGIKELLIHHFPFDITMQLPAHIPVQGNPGLIRFAQSVTRLQDYRGDAYDPDQKKQGALYEELQHRPDDRVKAEIIQRLNINEPSPIVIEAGSITLQDIGFGAAWADLYKRLIKEQKRVVIRTSGSAGQRFGQILGPYITLEHAGPVHDYAFTGMAKEAVAIVKQAEGTTHPDDQQIMGNSCFYGATAGIAYVQGKVAERFAVRNSGAEIIVSGKTGQYSAEYMTLGSFVALSGVGTSFGCGMAGGVAVIHSHDVGALAQRIDSRYVQLLPPEEQVMYLGAIKDSMERMVRHTGSERAQYLLDNWEEEKQHFQVVLPKSMVLLQEILRTEDVESKNYHLSLKQLKDICILYHAPSVQITPLEQVWLNHTLSIALERDLALRAAIGGKQGEEQLAALEDYVERKRQFSWDDIASKSSKKPKKRVEEKSEHTESADSAGRFQETASQPSCDCGAATCQGDDGCGLKRNSQQGSRMAEEAMNMVLARLRSSASLPEDALWEEAIQQIKDQRLEAGELIRFALAYRQYAEVSPLMFTKNVCPAPCQTACTKTNGTEAVPIRTYEALVDLFAQHYQHHPAIGSSINYFKVPEGIQQNTTPVAIIGSGPAGLQAAWRLAREGYTNVTVFEKADRPGGLTTYGIPPEKGVDILAERYVSELQEMGVQFVCNAEITSVEELSYFDKVIVATGVSHNPQWLGNVALHGPEEKDLKTAVETKQVTGVWQAMDMLTDCNRQAQVSRELQRPIDSYDDEFINKYRSLSNKSIVVIGSGDTGTDILTSLGHMAKADILKRGTYITLAKRDINLDDVPKVGKSYPLPPEVESPARAEAVKQLKELLGEEFVRDEEQLVPEALLFDSAGALTSMRFQHKEFVHSDARRYVKPKRGDSETKLIGNEEKKCDVLILATGFTGPKNSLLASVPRDEFDSRVFVIGDASPNKMYGREKQWTIVDAQGDANIGVDKMLGIQRIQKAGDIEDAVMKSKAAASTSKPEGVSSQAKHKPASTLNEPNIVNLFQMAMSRAA